MEQGWPRASQFGRSIRLEFSLYLSVAILVIMAVTGQVVTSRFVETVGQSVAEKLVVQARSFSGTAGKHIISEAGPDALMLSNICKKLAADNTDVYWAGIADQHNRFLAHTDIKAVVSGKSLVVPEGKSYADILRTDEAFAIRGDTIYTAIPITENGILLGRLGLAASPREIKAAREASILTVVSITLLMLVIGLPVTMLLVNRKLNPVKVIADHLKTMSLESPQLDIPVKSKNEFGYLAKTLNVMGQKLDAARQKMIENERMARELEIACEIQASILPKEYPSAQSYEFAGAYRSAKEVGGDYYDFIDFRDDHIACIVADVSGKSLPGMLVMLMTRDIIRQVTRVERQPAAVLCAVNKELRNNIKKGMFVTMFYGLLNRSTGKFTFASAGHNPLIHRSSGLEKPTLIKTKGYPLGLMAPAQFDSRIETGSIQLKAGDWLVQYTDGVNEAQNAASEEYGMDRLQECIMSATDGDPSVFVKTTMDNHSAFVGGTEQFDDITIMALKWTGIAVGHGIREVAEVVHAD
ncbi:MAG: SpoIIE family protein phosphatase [candidate division Zixibacteria bacterium]|nr:SpoIIE family protein phosphatase [candidate division Zixibacteria bacterium]